VSPFTKEGCTAVRVQSNGGHQDTHQKTVLLGEGDCQQESTQTLNLHLFKPAS
jgi:hypothetical protein